MAPLVRAIAAESADPEREPEVVGCWINVGWSVGLGVDPAHGWTDEAPDADEGGMVSVLVARRHGWDKLSVAGFLADVYCTGVKNYIGPEVYDERELRRFREYFFGEYKGYQEVPIELARHLVLGLHRLCPHARLQVRRGVRGPGGAAGRLGRAVGHHLRQEGPALLRAGTPTTTRARSSASYAAPSPTTTSTTSQTSHPPSAPTGSGRDHPCGCPRSSSRRAVEPSSRRAVEPSSRLGVSGSRRTGRRCSHTRPA